MLGHSRNRHGVLSCSGVRGDADDVAVLLLDYPSGATATVNLSTCRRDRSRGFEFVGEEGTLRYRLEEERLLSVATDGSASILLDHRGYDVNRMYVDLLADFLGIVTGGQSQIAADLEAGLHAIKICCEAESHAFAITKQTPRD